MQIENEPGRDQSTLITKEPMYVRHLLAENEGRGNDRQQYIKNS